MDGWVGWNACTSLRPRRRNCSARFWRRGAEGVIGIAVTIASKVARTMERRKRIVTRSSQAKDCGRRQVSIESEAVKAGNKKTRILWISNSNQAFENECMAGRENRTDARPQEWQAVIWQTRSSQVPPKVLNVKNSGSANMTCSGAFTLYILHAAAGRLSTIGLIYNPGDPKRRSARRNGRDLQQGRMSSCFRVIEARRTH
jgi:hypothetical protein